MTKDSCDYIIIGAGSAGCVIAYNILSRGQGSVLLLEAGGDDNNLFIKAPGGMAQVIPKKSWPYKAEQEPYTQNRVMDVLQGRVLGGGSSINGMVYVRGQRSDYDAWENDFGATGWNGDTMMHYFKKAENNEAMANQYHGNHGPLYVSENRYRHPMSDAFVRAGQQAGYDYIVDHNGARMEGVGFYQTTTHKGERASTSRTYLKKVRDDKNLKLQLNALVSRIEIENGRATGVTYKVHGHEKTVSARKEVIVSAGAIGSAKVLQLSGVGPKAVLAKAGIKQKAELPVGKNFHDHLHMSVNATIKEPISLYGEDKGLKALRHGIEWVFARTGVLTSPILEAFAFIDSTGSGRPDVQFHFLPILDTWDDPDLNQKGHTHGVTIKAGHLHPKSRGEVEIRSSDPAELPRIRAAYLENEEDVQGQIRATKLALNFFKQPALAEHVVEIFNPACAADDDAGLEEYVRRVSRTVYHPVGTCRIGQDPATSVVDPELRVHGVKGLRVADSSVMPHIPSGNTNAPTIAIAERASDLICGLSTDSIVELVKKNLATIRGTANAVEAVE
ncbi:GMC family oxidoreductase [Alteromonas lipolytica]|uniref:Glucose-methanol-choline oxidoreductase n=1 Tax=Alteromonas lipolytica TaxID=1856405 RepID=A0A1E8FCA0_9ALTE|nr:GMC family oxidoreductase N-terminal domain-containing protein [Alteromonas lipolytica]OFI33535.1 glucose-methanol-choline oxidoreductase [Alteromonas lipolytica]GGF58841.1 glucose-methanol-choline oxidoreductase [Alteromonas lipolytica]